jgi:hypothetical protein
MARDKDEFLKLFASQSRKSGKASKRSLDWLKANLNNMTKINTGKNKLFTKSGRPNIGQMYFFMYDPKLKETLPFYDMFPLVFPIEFYSDGFLGINLHYLPPMARARLMDKLMDIAISNKYNDITKLAISYEVLVMNARRYKGYKNCIKRYLHGHVRSSYHQVESDDWGHVIMLPLQRWKINPNRKYAASPPY